MIKITKISNNRGLLTKEFTGDSPDNITKKNGSPNLYDGSFEVLSLDSLADFKSVIESLHHNEALSYSIPEIDSGIITTKGYEDISKNLISRSKDYFDYACGLGILMIDVDEEGLTETEVIDRLPEEFHGCSYVYATSASNGIEDKTGFHLYFLVEDLSDVKQAMDNVFNIAFNQGYGTMKVSSSGSLLPSVFCIMEIPKVAIRNSPLLQRKIPQFCNMKVEGFGTR